MPLLMSTTFAPDGERRLPAVHARTTAQNLKEIARHSKHDADAYDQYSHDMEMVCQAIKPLLRHGPAGHLQRRPRGAAGPGPARRALPEAWTSGSCTTRSACSPAAPPTSSTTTSSRTCSRATSRARASSAPRSGRARRAPGSSCSTTRSASTTASSGRGPSTSRATAGSPRSSPGPPQSFGAEIRLESPVDHVITQDGRATGVALERRHGVLRRHRRLARSIRGARSSSSSTRASCPTTSSRTSSATGSRARQSKVNFALDGLPDVPGPRPDGRQLPRLHEHRPVDGLPRARLRRAQVRLVQLAPVHRHGASSRPSTPTWRLPASTSCRASSSTRLPAARERLGHREGEPGRHRAADARVVLPGLRRPGAPARGRDAAAHRAHRRACPRATSSPASSSPRRCSCSGRRRAGSQYRTPIDGYYQCGSRHPSRAAA